MDKNERLQRKILKRLEKLNEELLDNDDYEKRMKKFKRKNKIETSHQANSNKPDTSTDTESRRKKKKKKRKLEKDQSRFVSSEDVDVKVPKLTGEKKHLQALKQAVCLTESDIDDTDRNDSTCGSSRTEEPEVIVFHTKRKQKEEKPENPSPTFKQSNNQPEFDLKKTRGEVQKFGISGFQGTQKEEAMTAFLVKLGAKPPKNKHYNYKEFQELRKQEMQAVKSKKEMDRRLGFKVKNTGQTKKSKDRNDVGIVDGQVGRYKDGVQYIRKTDLKGLNQRNKARQK